MRSTASAGGLEADATSTSTMGRVDRVRNQYVAVICVNLASFVYGLGLGWASPNVPLLLSADSPLASGPVTLDQSSWISSLFCLGGACGGIVFGALLDLIGRKWCITAIGVPQLCSWALIAFGPNVGCIYVARFLIGMSGGGIIVAVPVFVAEISVDRIRGVLGFVFGVMCCSGTLVIFVLTHFFGYVLMPCFALAVSAMFLTCMLWLPDTPRYLLTQRHQVDAAKRSLTFYRQLGDDEKTVQMEVDRMQRDEQRRCSANSKDGVTWADLRVATSRRGIIVGLVLIAMTQFCGSFAIINYTSAIFADAGSTWHPNVCAMVIALLQVLATFTFISLIDRVGRKVLILVSGVATSVSLGTLGAYFYAKSSGWDVSGLGMVPLVSLATMMFVVIGVSTLPYVLVVELLPPHLRSSVPSYFMFMLWALGFVFVKYFNDMVLVLQMHGCMWFFAGCCAAEVLFIAVWMPETKGRSYEEIRKALK